MAVALPGAVALAVAPMISVPELLSDMTSDPSAETDW